MSGSLLAAGLSIGGKLIERIFPDPEQRDKARLALAELEQSGELQALAARAGIVEAEARSEHWLTSTWRPIVMLSLAAMMGAHWFGFTPDSVNDAQALAMFDLLKLGIGGYVFGRSAEKFAREWKRPGSS